MSGTPVAPSQPLRPELAAVWECCVVFHRGLTMCLECLPKDAYTNLFAWFYFLFGCIGATVAVLAHYRYSESSKEQVACNIPCMKSAWDALWNAVCASALSAEEVPEPVAYPNYHEECSDWRRQLMWCGGYAWTGVILNVGLVNKLRFRPVPGTIIYGFQNIKGWFYEEPGGGDIFWFIPSPLGESTLRPFKVEQPFYRSRWFGRPFGLNMARRGLRYEGDVAD